MLGSEYIFRLGMIAAISLLATLSGLVVQHAFGTRLSTLLVGPALASLAVLVWWRLGGCKC